VNSRLSRLIWSVFGPNVKFKFNFFFISHYLAKILNWKRYSCIMYIRYKDIKKFLNYDIEIVHGDQNSISLG
jgi:hypothetical protein